MWSTDYLCKQFGTRSGPCLAADTCLTADPGVASSISVWSHTFIEIDHEIISSHFPPIHWFKKGCCQLQEKVCAQSTGYLLGQACPGKKCGLVNWRSWHDHSCWLGRKESNQKMSVPDLDPNSLTHQWYSEVIFWKGYVEKSQQTTKHEKFIIMHLLYVSGATLVFTQEPQTAARGSVATPIISDQRRSWSRDWFLGYFYDFHWNKKMGSSTHVLQFLIAHLKQKPIGVQAYRYESVPKTKFSYFST